MGWIKGILSIGTIWGYAKWVISKISKLRKIAKESADVIRQGRRTLGIARAHYKNDGKLSPDEVDDIFIEIDKLFKELEDLIKVLVN